MAEYNSRVTGSMAGANAPSYSIRPATLDDADVLVRHRIGMFTDMGVPLDAPLARARVPRLARRDDAERHVSRVGRRRRCPRDRRGRRHDDPAVAAGSALHRASRLAFVYNVYTEPAHRRRGLARLLMDAMHAWCRAHGIASMALNASRDGQPLYEVMGYAVSPAPMMFFPLSP